MGDRAIIIVHNEESQDYGPTIYLHWDGSHLPALLKEWWTYMDGRRGDVEYGAARLIGLAHVMIDGNLSLGVWNITADTYASAMRQSRGAEYSHGDAGTIHVDAETGIVVGQWGYSDCWGDAGTWDLNNPPETF